MTEDTTPEGLAGDDDESPPVDPTPPRVGWRKVIGLGAAAVIAIGGGAWAAVALLGGGEDEPAESPSASASPGSSPTASASQSASASPTETINISVSTPGEVTVDPTLPEALPLPDGIWDDVGDGWVLAGYAPSTDYNTAEHYVLYLVSPEGQRYQVLELDPELMWRVVAWEGGSSPALMTRSDEGSHVWGYLDLGSGRLSAIEAKGADEEYLLGVNANGEYVMQDLATGEPFIVLRDRDFTAIGALEEVGNSWSPGGLWWITSVDYGETDQTLTISSLVGDDAFEFALDLPADKGYCSEVGWVDDGTILVVCDEVDFSESGEGTNSGTTFLSFEVDGDGGYEVLAEVVVPDRAFGRAEVVDGAIVTLGVEMIDGVGGNLAEELTVIRDGVATRIPSSAYGVDMWGPYPMTVVGTRVYVVWGIPGDSDSVAYLSVDDIAAGTSTLLIPPYVPEGDAWATSAMVSCVVVGSHEALSY